MSSKDLFNESKKYLSGGVNSPIRAFKPYPFFTSKGKGSKIWDVDGNSYIDHCLGYGPLILGHSHPSIVKAINEQIAIGTTYGTPTEKEIELAKRVIERVACVEMIRFVNSGTEATMGAIRLARGFTGRDKIIKFDGGYHGSHDAVLVKPDSGGAGKPDSLGIPSDTSKNTLSIPFNNEEKLIETINKYKDEIATIIVEPVMGNIGVLQAKKGFLKFLRDITSENDILLIFDEVITGFRLSYGSASEYFNINPDLVTFGKILGGGFPIGAFGGRKELMKMIAPSGDVYQAGTFNGNPISITGGITTLNELNQTVYKSLNQKGKFLRNRITESINDLSLDLSPVGVASMFQIYFRDGNILNYEDVKKSDLEKFNTYFKILLKNGIFIPPSQFESCFISNAHNDDDIEKTATIIHEALKEVFK
ncbi:MAG: glutamate-1-semialdehyde 2,1-aminomutase [Methanobrevibacter sp.]|jgi:glutamate-1-semialdehyde 2,1-aminomutase|nr:glutamate-1-semialdehyde 2,1-aminomutase [Methanobrevibacter sp.]